MIERDNCIREWREDFGLTQAHVADRAGIPLEEYIKLEEGRILFEDHHIKKIARVFECEPGALVFDGRHDQFAKWRGH